MGTISISGPNLAPSNWRVIRWLDSLNAKHYFILVYLLALIPRLLIVFAAGKAPLSLDEIEYDRIAWYLSEGKGFLWFFGMECTYRPPLYPGLISLVYVLFGPDYFYARIFQVFISAFIGYFTYLVSKRAINDRAGKISGLCMALYPPLLFYSLALMPENVFIPVLLLTLFFLLKAKQSGSLNYTVASGIFMAFSILIRPSFSPFLILLLPWFYLPEKNIRHCMIKMSCITAIVLVPVSIWSYRNYCITGQFVYLDTRTGYNLFIGYNKDATGTFDMHSATKMCDAFIVETFKKAAPGLSVGEARRLFSREITSYQSRKHMSFTDIDLSNAEGDVWLHNYGKEKAIQFILDHPLHALRLLPKKFMYFWNLEQRLFLFAYSHNVIGWLPNFVLVVLSIVILAPFAVFTLSSLFSIILSKMTPERALLILPIFYFTALHTATFGESRFHFAIVPLIAAFAADSWTMLKIQRTDFNLIVFIKSFRIRLLIILSVATMFLFIWGYDIYTTMDQWQAVFGPSGNLSSLPF